jgi:hypothetical protein
MCFLIMPQRAKAASRKEFSGFWSAASGLAGGRHLL